MKTFSLISFLLVFSYSVASQSGKVIKVKDGDTIVVLDADFEQHTIRVADIDCPEKGQPFGKNAKMFTSAEVFSKNVIIKKKKIDRYGRVVGFVFYGDKDLSLELLKKGLAWHYKYYSKDAIMAKLENKARAEKIGLWSELKPINPYDWRKGLRN